MKTWNFRIEMHPIRKSRFLSKVSARYSENFFDTNTNKLMITLKNLVSNNDTRLFKASSYRFVSFTRGSPCENLIRENLVQTREPWVPIPVHSVPTQERERE
jgi:hypothetical protein